MSTVRPCALRCEGDITTNFLYEHYPEGFMGKQLTTDEQRSVVAVSAALYYERLAAKEFGLYLSVAITTESHF